MMSRQSLTGILNGDLAAAFNAAAPATDGLPPITDSPVLCAVSGGLKTSRGGTPGYTLVFEVVEGQFTGRRLYHDLWLTPAAMPLAKRDLARLGITTAEQLTKPIPPGILCEVKHVVRTDDDGVQRNAVKSFAVTGVDADPTADKDFAAPTEGGVA
jgi:hypothetical protein